MRELKHILVVEDDEVMRNSLELMLQKHYDVHCEKYGKMAVAYAKYQKVDLILLNMNLRFLNGLETLEKLREISDYELCPVVFLSDPIDYEKKQRCKELGAKAFLKKPITAEKLRKALDAILYETKRKRMDFGKQRPGEGAEMMRDFVPIAESALLIGENRDFLRKMRNHLQGYLPRIVEGKEEVLLYLDKLRPAVIYVEDDIASAADFNLIRKMRMQPYTWEIPIVLFTQKDDLKHELDRYKQEGIELVLQNPTKEAILETLKEALS